MLKAFIGLLILLFPIVAFSILRGMVEARFHFHRVATGTIAIAAHLAVILGWYKLKALIFRDSMRCSACGWTTRTCWIHPWA